MDKKEDVKLDEGKDKEKRSMELLQMDHPLTGNFNAERAIKQAQERVQFFKQIKAVSLGMTNAGDWTNQSGKPYLGGSGVEKLKPVWGIYFKDIKIERIPDGDGYIFECRGVAGSKVTGEESEFVGGRNSNDPFFTGKDGTRKVDLMDVRKASYTNFEVNAVMRLLGMRNLTWEDIKIDKKKVSTVEYQKGSQGGAVKGDEKTEELREEIRSMLIDMAFGEENVAKAALETYTEWTDKDGKKHAGKQNVKYLTVKQIPVVYGKIKKDYDKWVKKNMAAENKEVKNGQS